MKQRVSVFLFCFLGASCQSTPEPILPTHMLRLECKSPDGTQAQSRAAVLNIGDPKYDFALATGHAVPSERPCVVKDFAGGQSPVSLIKLADGYQSGHRTDWAIIRFDKIRTRDLVRFNLDPIENIESLTEKQFEFARARGLQSNSQKCSLSILNFSQGNRRVVHDCKAVPGQSGSPLTRWVDGEPMLVGLHIGHLWMFQSPETGRPDKKGYINLLDQETVDEINSVIEENTN